MRPIHTSYRPVTHRAFREDAAQPYVWVDVRPDDVTDVLLNLVIGNSGPTIAQNVRATIDPPLEAIDQLKDRTDTAQDLLARGISSLPPGRTLMWPLGQGFNILAGDSPKRHTVTVTANGPFGPVLPPTYVLDLTDYRGHMHRPVGSVQRIRKPFVPVAPSVAPIRARLPAPLVALVLVATVVTARTLQGMAGVRSGQAPAWPLVSDRSVRSGSRVKRDFACTSTGVVPPVPVALRAQESLGARGADTYTQRAIPGPEPS